MVASKTDEQHLLDALVSADNYPDWWKAASALDDDSDKYNWRVNPIDELYDYKLIEERRKELFALRRNDNVIALANCLRQGLLRNLFNITRLPLYEKSYLGTKDNITQYIEESVEAIRYIAESPNGLTSGGGRLTAQEKLDVLHDSRKSFGATALLLQGGSIFGMCHLGVIKALLEHGILPKVIVGTSTGAVMAALVGVRTLEEMPALLEGSGIDLTAFTAATAARQEKLDADSKMLEYPPDADTVQMHNTVETMERRAFRWLDEGFLLDPEVLDKCIEANVGDVTFREAFDRTGRVLNIIISSPNEEIPNLLNHLSAPDVLIRSGAMASHITNMARMPKAGIKLLYKLPDGSIQPYDFKVKGVTVQKFASATDLRKIPLARVRQQFNVDHFIISQARPYVAPFLKPSLPYIRSNPTASTPSSASWTSRLFAIPSVGSLVKHGLLVTDIFGWLPDGLRRVLSDEMVTGDSLTLVPEFNINDYLRLLRNPTGAEIDYWILRGERAVWPSLCALKVRCMIEVALDQAYERVRRRSPSDAPVPLVKEQMSSRPKGPQRANTTVGQGPGGQDVQNAWNALDEHRRRKLPAVVLEEEVEQVGEFEEEKTGEELSMAGG